MTKNRTLVTLVFGLASLTSMGEMLVAQGQADPSPDAEQQVPTQRRPDGPRRDARVRECREQGRLPGGDAGRHSALPTQLGHHSHLGHPQAGAGREQLGDPVVGHAGVGLDRKWCVYRRQVV